MVERNIAEKHGVFNSRTDVDGEAIRSLRHQAFIEHYAIIPPTVVEDQSLYRFVVEDKIDCAGSRRFHPLAAVQH